MSKLIRNIAIIKPVATEVIKKPIGIILLSAGMSNRMKSKGSRSLIEINEEETLVNYQIRILERNFTNIQKQIILVGGHDADKVFNRVSDKIIKVENELFETTNMVRSLNIALRVCLYDRIFIIPGDLVFNSQIFEQEFADKSIVLLEKTDKVNEDTIGCTINQKGKLELLMYNLQNTWQGITYLTGKELSFARHYCSKPTNKNKNLMECVNYIVSKGGNIYPSINNKNKSLDIDTYKDIIEAKKYYESNNYK